MARRAIAAVLHFAPETVDNSDNCTSQLARPFESRFIESSADDENSVDELRATRLEQLKDTMINRKNLSFNLNPNLNDFPCAQLKPEIVKGAVLKYTKVRLKSGEVEIRVSLKFIVDTLYFPWSLFDFHLLPIYSDPEFASVETDYSESILAQRAPEWLEKQAGKNEKEYFISKIDTVYIKNLNMKELKIKKPRVYQFGIKNREFLFDFYADVPQEQTDHTVIEDIISKTKTNEPLYRTILDLFEKQPIWNFNQLWNKLSGVKEKSQFSTRVFTRLIAYKFHRGPWSKLWIRRGYDPRKDPNAKTFQVLAINIMRYLPNFDDTLADKDSLAHIDERTVPHKQSALPQLKDVHIARVQALVHVNDGQEASCTLEDGWCVPGTLDSCRSELIEKIVCEYNRRLERHNLHLNEGEMRS